ncbi:AAA family ATPase [Phytoactinopolyspora alkaliphila]|uniref:AAA family ATPase n=1 Tax=Phytoactinopolyspora alkaliphila TaxID=1783498 RepID=A0A6N9YMJ2_9ACTN|nr:AAA family ATPase [Phytoactinopolyspora alkaliphila]NED96140.1 AAA family ATPase [Phytoactinopolyspora alkaliphila]
MLNRGVVLISGIMASGKSTVADLLARRLPRAAHVRGDVFRRLIVTGGVPPAPGDDEGLEQLWLRYRITAGVADKYAEAGFTAVVQDVVLGPVLADYTTWIQARPLYVVVLAPRADVVARRESDRAKTGYGDWTVRDLDTSLREETPRLGLWLDTSDQTPEETVDEILARIDEAAV